MRNFGNFFRRVKTAEEIAGAIVYLVAKDAFIHIRNRGFRDFLSLDSLTSEEIFDLTVELEISGVTLAYLLLESMEGYYEDDRTKQALRSIHNSLTAAFVKHIKRGERDARMHAMMAQLIARRCEECREGLQHHLSEFKPGDLKRNYWPAICAENLFNHLFDETNHEFFDHLAAWNVYLANEIQKAILKRARVISRGK